MLAWAWEGCTRWPPRIPSPQLYWEDGDTLLVAQVLPPAPALGFNGVLSRASSNRTAWAASPVTPLRMRPPQLWEVSVSLGFLSRQGINLGRETRTRRVACPPPPAHC